MSATQVPIQAAVFYTMPHMTGTDLTRELNAIRPDIPIIMCTGLNDLIKAESAKQAGIRELVRKPATMLQMAEAIRRALKG